MDYSKLQVVWRNDEPPRTVLRASLYIVSRHTKFNFVKWVCYMDALQKEEHGYESITGI
jgi:hypothetical protein